MFKVNNIKTPERRLWAGKCRLGIVFSRGFIATLGATYYIKSQLAFTCSNSTMETPELCLKSLQSLHWRYQNDVILVPVFLTLSRSKQFSGVSVANFEHVNGGWYGFWLYEVFYMNLFVFLNEAWWLTHWVVISEIPSFISASDSFPMKSLEESPCQRLNVLERGDRASKKWKIIKKIGIKAPPLPRVVLVVLTNKPKLNINTEQQFNTKFNTHYYT